MTREMEKRREERTGRTPLKTGWAFACAALVGASAFAAPSAAALHNLEITCDTDKGKVSGAGNYAAGKKVTLKATAAKGYVFSGWYYDGEGRLDQRYGLRNHRL